MPEAGSARNPMSRRRFRRRSVYAFGLLRGKSAREPLSASGLRRSRGAPLQIHAKACRLFEKAATAYPGPAVRRSGLSEDRSAAAATSNDERPGTCRSVTSALRVEANGTDLSTDHSDPPPASRTPPGRGSSCGPVPSGGSPPSEGCPEVGSARTEP